MSGIPLVAVAMVTPLLSKELIDRVYPSHDVSLLNAIAIVGLAVAIARSTIGAMRSYYGNVVAVHMARAIGQFYFDKMVRKPMTLYDTSRVGDLFGRAGELRSAISGSLALVEALTMVVIYSVAIPPIVLLVSWELSLLSLIASPLTALVGLIASKLRAKHLRRGAEAQAEVANVQLEVLNNIRTIKVLAGEDEASRRTAERYNELVAAQTSAGIVAAGATFLVGLIQALTLSLVTWVAWTMIISGRMTLGEYVLFTMYVGYLTAPVARLTGLLGTLQSSGVAAQRALEYLLVAEEQWTPSLSWSQRRALEPTCYSMGAPVMQVKGVSFSYSSGQHCLSDIHLSLWSASTTAIVGRSGSGKSTLLKLLVRMYDPSSGEIQLRGEPIGCIPLRDLRSRVALVHQEIGLVKGSLRENLQYGLGAVHDHSLWSMLDVCQLADTVRAFPSGLDQNISEWGASLSGGQRQRLAIARALLRDPDILLLDEASSQFEVESERRLIERVRLLKPSLSIVIVTHRLASVSLDARVIVVDQGRVVDEGRHERLVAESASYRELLIPG